MVHATGNRHDAISKPLCGEAPNLLDHPTPCHPGHDLCYDDAGMGDAVMEAPGSHAPLLACGGFSWLPRHPPGRRSALHAGVCGERGVGRRASLGLIRRLPWRRR